MSTEYYVKDKFNGEVTVIGLSAGGWCFQLKVVEEKGLVSLEDWIIVLKNPLNVIYDEYGQTHSPQDMVDIITNRTWKEGVPFSQRFTPDAWYASIEAFHESNKSEEGPNGLLRCKVDFSRCIGHGAGTWDYVI